MHYKITVMNIFMFRQGGAHAFVLYNYYSLMEI